MFLTVGWRVSNGTLNRTRCSLRRVIMWCW